MRKFAVFDIDGTLIRWQLYHSLANQFAKQGLLGEGGLQKIKAARLVWKNREHPGAFKDYERLLVKEFDAAMPTISQQTFEKAVKHVIDEYKLQTYRYSRDLLSDLKKQGYLLLAISGSHTELIAHIASHYGFDDFAATIYKRSGSAFTGEKDVPSLDKRAALEKLIAKHQLSIKDSVGVGDTYSDIPMLEMVERPIVFNPEQQLFKVAKQNKWQIVVERKNVIYKLDFKDGKYILA